MIAPSGAVRRTSFTEKKNVNSDRTIYQPYFFGCFLAMSIIVMIIAAKLMKARTVPMIPKGESADEELLVSA